MCPQMKWTQVLWKGKKLNWRQDLHNPGITATTTTVMTTDRQAVSERNKRRQEIKEQLTLNVKWQAQIKTGGMTSLEVGNEGGGDWCGGKGMGLEQEGPGVPVHRLHPM